MLVSSPVSYKISERISTSCRYILCLGPSGYMCLTQFPVVAFSSCRVYVMCLLHIAVWCTEATSDWSDWHLQFRRLAVYTSFDSPVGPILDLLWHHTPVISVSVYPWQYEMFISGKRKRWTWFSSWQAMQHIPFPGIRFGPGIISCWSFEKCQEISVHCIWWTT